MIAWRREEGIESRVQEVGWWEGCGGTVDDCVLIGKHCRVISSEGGLRWRRRCAEERGKRLGRLRGFWISPTT